MFASRAATSHQTDVRMLELVRELRPSGAIAAAAAAADGQPARCPEPFRVLLKQKEVAPCAVPQPPAVRQGVYKMLVLTSRHEERSQRELDTRLSCPCAFGAHLGDSCTACTTAGMPAETCPFKSFPHMCPKPVLVKGSL
jgi:hypothetical protein